MSPLARICSRHGGIVLVSEECLECVAEGRGRRKARWSAGDPEHTRLMGSYAWKRARRAARRRDGGCVRRGDGLCEGRLEVHHVVRPRHGGHPTALSNLQTLCRRHHELEERSR